jgi:hypothetical protein
MSRRIIILYLLITAGCKTQNAPPPVSRLDIAIENLSMTSRQLDELREEKDLFTKSLEDFVEQKAEHIGILDTNEIYRETRAFAEWRRDITQREKDLNIEHSMNISAAHREIAKRKTTEANKTASYMPPYRNP